MQSQKIFKRPLRIKSCFKKKQYNTAIKKQSKSLFLPDIKIKSDQKGKILKTQPNDRYQENKKNQSQKDKTQQLVIFYPKLNNFMHMKKLQQQMKNLEIIQKRYIRKNKNSIPYEKTQPNLKHQFINNTEKKAFNIKKQNKRIKRQELLPPSRFLNSQNGFITFKPYKIQRLKTQ